MLDEKKINDICNYIDGKDPFMVEWLEIAKEVFCNRQSKRNYYKET